MQPLLSCPEHCRRLFPFVPQNKNAALGGLDQSKFKSPSGPKQENGPWAMRGSLGHGAGSCRSTLEMAECFSEMLLEAPCSTPECRMLLWAGTSAHSPGWVPSCVPGMLGASSARGAELWGTGFQGRDRRRHRTICLCLVELGGEGLAGAAMGDIADTSRFVPCARVRIQPPNPGA